VLNSKEIGAVARYSVPTLSLFSETMPKVLPTAEERPQCKKKSFDPAEV
jgi:hypothetical protein